MTNFGDRRYLRSEIERLLEDKMKLPKKLDIMDLLDLKEEYLFEQLFYKVNELVDVVRKHRIDFLTYSGWDREELNELLGEEASKGECNHHPNFKKENGDCVMCVLDKPKNPPQQEECPKCGKKMVGMYCCDLSSQEALDILKDLKPEESMGECLTCGKPVRSGSTKEVCVCPERKPDGSWKPQLKEETFKEPLCKECGEWRGCHPMDKCRKYVEEESPKEDEGGDLLSNCCAWDFDPLGFEKEEGIWQERCGRCGRLCEPIYLSKRDILNIQRCKTMESK